VLPTAPNLTPGSTAVAKWESKGGGVAGIGPAMGTDGTVYVATMDGDYSATAFSDAVVALEGQTLVQKDYFTPGKTPFTGSPVVFQYKGKDVIAAPNKDGRIYLLDSTSLGGADHKTPMAKSAGGPGELSGLSTFEDTDGTRWIFAASSAAIAATTGNAPPGAVVAFRLVDQNGTPAFQMAWTSRDIASPVTPVFVNGVVFALASGEARLAGQRAGNALLYALDAATGKELWNSGTTITSSVHNVAPAVDDGQVLVMTSDGTLYTFGFVVER
jgi:outer membrane protein assembly factor BamB